MRKNIFIFERNSLLVEIHIYPICSNIPCEWTIDLCNPLLLLLKKERNWRRSKKKEREREWYKRLPFWFLLFNPSLLSFSLTLFCLTLHNLYIDLFTYIPPFSSWPFSVSIKYFHSFSTLSLFHAYFFLSLFTYKYISVSSFATE